MSKMLDKIAKLLNKAENAGTPEEAEAFMAKVQELAAINQVDLAVARAHQSAQERTGDPVERKITVNPHTRKRNRKHFVELAMAICDVNDIKYLISGNDSALFAVGFPADLDVAESLYAHLSVQMATEADEAIARGDHRANEIEPKTEKVEIHESERAWGEYNPATDRYYDVHPVDEGDFRSMEEYEDCIKQDKKIYNYDTDRYRRPYPPPKHKYVPVLDDDGEPIMEEKSIIVVDARVFRGNFYESFVSRMRGRLWEIRQSVERQKGGEDRESTTALALRDKREEVDKAHADQRAKVVHMGTWQGSGDTGRKTDYTGRGHEAGRRSAESVPIDSGREVKS